MTRQLSIEVINDIAEAFQGKVYAFVAVPLADTDEFRLGVAVANERGYSPVPAFHYAADTYDEAEAQADKLNKNILSLDDEAVWKIVASTMRKSPAPYRVSWEIDIDAGDPIEAATLAHDMVRKPGSIANVYTVTDELGNSTQVDLQEVLEGESS